MALPYFQSNVQPLSMMQTQWASQLNPLLATPLVNGRLISNQTVVSGQNIIYHQLGRALQGYIVVLNSAHVSFWDSQATNTDPTTLLLNASGAAVITLYVF